MTNKKRKGFTIVELVIVIAVIAILAGVLIPTFASIIDKANQSADIQAVRQMNVLLKAESVENKPTDVNKVIEIVSEAGYTDTKLTPKSKDHGFYWHSDTNTIVLVKDPANEPAELIYPLDNEELTAEFDPLKASWTTNGHAGFYDLAVEGGTGGNGSGSNEIYDAAGLIAALTDPNKTGTITLSNDIALSLDTLASIDCKAGTADTPFVIDLNKKTLTLTCTVSLNILNNITIKNGQINITNILYEYVNPSLMGENPDLFFTLISMPGFYVSPTGRLSIKNVNILGSRDYSVKNDGEITLTNTNWNLDGTLTCGGARGLNNSGTARINVEGEDGISKFISNDVAEPIYNSDTITIENTSFIEGELFSGYINDTPIKSTGGTVTFNSGSVTISKGPDSCINASSSTNLTINGGSFRGKIACDETSPVTINGGEFYIVTETEAKYVDFNELTTAEQIYRHICFTDYNVILKAVDNPDGSTTKTCTITNSTSTNKYIFKDTNIADNEDISIYLSVNGVVLTDEEMTISGNLSIQGKRLYVGETANPKQIIVNPTGTLSLNVELYYVYLEDGNESSNGCGEMTNRLQIIKDATGKFGTVNFRPNHNIYTDGDGNLVQVDKTDKVTILKEPVTLTE